MKMDKYLDLARKQKKLWHMKVLLILIVLGALKMVLKCLEKSLGENEEARPSRLLYCKDELLYFEEFWRP